MIRKKHFRLSEAAILMLPPFAAAGSYLLPLEVGGVVLFGYRLLVLLLFLYLLLTGRAIRKLRSKTEKFFVMVGFVWVAWGMCSVLWSCLLWGASPLRSLREIIDVSFGLLSCLTLTKFLEGDPRKANILRMGWVLAFLVTGAVALWEINSGNHLPGYATEGLELEAAVYSTLGNPNNYAAFLALSFPFLLWSVRISNGYRKIVFATLLGSLPILMVLAAGRLAMLALILEIFLFAVLQILRPVRNWRVVFAIAGLILCLLLAVGWYQPTAVKYARLFEEFDSGGSAYLRFNVYRDGLRFLWMSYGTGIGPANFQHLMITGLAPYGAEGLVDPHNFWLEVASQYGLIVFGFLLTWFGLAASSAWRARSLALRYPSIELESASESVLLGLAGYVLVAAENSAYIPQSTNWLFIGSLLSLAGWFDCATYRTVTSVRRLAGYSDGSSFRGST